ncbi:MAG: glycosyltransferase family 4 protein, partial [Planctomycetota bacterium]
DILRLYGPYGITPDHVKVLPFLPACYLAADVPRSDRRRVRENHRLPERFLFYPAQFWPHKNHVMVVRALGLLERERGVRAPIALCGSHSGEHRETTFREVMTRARALGVCEQIRYLGYVDDEDMSALYAEAAALVMPTFFGPTNIPILEAWAFGCPVITSDIRGVREQAGDAAILVDPRSVEAIAEAIHKVWTDEGLRRKLAARGRRRLAAYAPVDYRRRLTDIVEEAAARIRSGKRRHGPRMPV